MSLLIGRPLQGGVCAFLSGLLPGRVRLAVLRLAGRCLGAILRRCGCRLFRRQIARGQVGRALGKDGLQGAVGPHMAAIQLAGVGLGAALALFVQL